LPLLRTVAAAMLVVGEAVPDAKGGCVLPCQYGVNHPEEDRTEVLVDAITFGVAQNPRTAHEEWLLAGCIDLVPLRATSLRDSACGFVERCCVEWDITNWHLELIDLRQLCLLWSPTLRQLLCNLKPSYRSREEGERSLESFGDRSLCDLSVEDYRA
jgi:hypothetical protein